MQITGTDQSQLGSHAKRRRDNDPRPVIGQWSRLKREKAELPTLSVAEKVLDKYIKPSTLTYSRLLHRKPPLKEFEWTNLRLHTPKICSKNPTVERQGKEQRT